MYTEDETCKQIIITVSAGTLDDIHMGKTF